MKLKQSSSLSTRRVRRQVSIRASKHIQADDKNDLDKDDDCSNAEDEIHLYTYCDYYEKTSVTNVDNIGVGQEVSMTTTLV